MHWLFLVAMSLWRRGLSGEGSRRWRKGEQKAAGTPQWHRDFVPESRSLGAKCGSFLQAEKCTWAPQSPHTRCQRITDRGGLHGILEGPGWDCEDKSQPAYLHSSGDILSHLVSFLRFPLWSLSWKVWSPQCTNPQCWDIVCCIQVPL